MLSKSKYVSGRQCLKKLYFEKHRPELKAPVSAALQARFDQGHTVGALAQKLYPGGKDATPESYSNFAPSIEQTRRWINSGYEVIYEATFAEEGVLAMLDIFLKRDGFIYALEVKSSTKVKDYHVWDAAIQYYVMEKAGFRPDRFYIVHLNRNYVKQGDIRVDELFTKVNITEDVLALQADIPQELAEMKSTLKAGEEPDVDIGAHCSTPFACDFVHHCWQHVPSPSVFELYRAGAKAWGFYERGQLALADLDESQFHGRARLQIEGAKYGREVIRRDKIAAWLATADYPLYFLDFETTGMSLGIPVYDGTRPYQQIPVQYSLHVLEHPNASLQHYEYLPDFSQDPREALAEALCAQIGAAGSVVAYFKGFESGCLNHLAECFPHLADRLVSIRDRLFDLIEPFQKSWLYKPAMGGSASIKSVYPALFPGQEGYQGLIINNGGDASRFLAELAKGTVRGSAEEKEQLRQDLLAYCKLDTEAMVKIWRYLEGLQ